ncbi:MAG: glycosyltransferase family 39 protein, partial [Planctomycetaceae bacterium]|nr:glycosyltransferase family 39 protein [Planctomycetaceae bacterium]
AYTTANHPLQSLLSWCALPLGVEPWIRLPSILSGAAAVLGAWWIGRACREGTTLATWMAFAMAVLPAAVNAGSEARGYGLMIAASSLSTGLLLMAMKHGGSWRWIAYAIVLALGVWGHLVTAMVGVGHAALAVWMLRSPATRSIALRMLAAVACAAALSIALWSPALPDLLHTRSQFSASRGDEPTLFGHEGDVLLWNLMGMGALPRPGVGSGGLWGTLLVLPLLAIGLRGCFADRGARKALAASALGLPIALALVWVAGSWFYARFMLFALPGVALVAGVGAANLMRARSGHGIGRWLALVPAVMAFIAWPLFCTIGPRQPIREAVAWVAANRGSDDVIVGIGIADDVVQWYAMANQLTVHPTGLNGATAPETIARLRPRWIIQLYPQHTTRPETVAAAEQLGSWTTRTFRGSIDDGDVVVLQRTP